MIGTRKTHVRAEAPRGDGGRYGVSDRSDGDLLLPCMRCDGCRGLGYAAELARNRLRLEQGVELMTDAKQIVI